MPYGIKYHHRWARQGTSATDSAEAANVEVNRTSQVQQSSSWTSVNERASTPSQSTGVDPLRTALTPSDRELIYKITGQKIEDSPGALVAPGWVLMLAGDRQSGALPAGQPITADYITDMASKWGQIGGGGGVQNGLSDAILQRFADYFAAHGGKARNDFTA
jgi:hypothetical protein